MRKMLGAGALGVAALVAASLFAAPVSAATATFSNFDNVADDYYLTNFVSSSVQFMPTGPEGFVAWSKTSPYRPDPASATIALLDGDAIIVPGGPGGNFRLYSFDLADLYNAGVAEDFTVYLTPEDGSPDIIQHFTLDALAGLQTIVFDGTPLSSFRLEGAVQIDNISYLPHRTDGIPEPGTWALMLLGFGATGSMVRARRRRVLPA